VAVVLDASGSMRLPASADRDLVMRGLAQQILGPLGGLIPQASGPSRLQAAQQAVNRTVRSLPSDVDVGLVVLADCPRASEYGFFSGTQRDRLYGSVNSLRPMQKTPLADGILRAGNLVDGVKAPAVMVVVSDGEDTCGGDPCAAARALKARKPLLKINVVDIVGDGRSNCIANATGGRVLNPQSGSAFDETIHRATQEAQKPAHCK
jgi:Mg-chelatase subunit ChlD